MSVQRLHALDALRGLAALYVVIYHDTLRFPRFMQGLPMDGGALLPGLTQEEAGVIPVLWFFIISGFVITWTVGRCRTPMDFIVSRVSRLYPAFWAALAVSVALQVAWPFPGEGPGVGQVLAHVTMLHEFVGFANVDGVYWSLTVELRFYAYVLALFTLGLWRYVHVAALLWAGAGLLAAVLPLAGFAMPWRAQQVLMTEFGPFFAAGMMLYQLWRGQRVAWAWTTLAVCAGALLAGYRPVSAASCIVVAGMIGWACRGGLRWLAWPPLLWLGSVSYALYLSHQTASFMVLRFAQQAGWPWAAGVAAGVAVALVLAAAVTMLVEQPALRAMRAAWGRVRPGSVPPAGAAPAVPQAIPATPGSPG